MTRLTPRLAAVATAMLLLAGCTVNPVQVTPKLPLGFLDATVPSVDAAAYLFVSSDPPMEVSLRHFGNPADANDNPRFARIPEYLEIERAALTAGSKLDEFGGEVGFSRDLLAEIAEDVVKEKSGLSVFRNESSLNIVVGTSGWADALKRALEKGERSAFQDAHPEAWELLRMMPQSPPARPVAAGFAKVEGGLLEEASGRLKLNLSGVTQALGSLNVSQVAFVAYAEGDLRVKESIGPAFFQEYGASVAVAMRSGYPGFLLGFFLDSFASQAGLEKGNTVAGVEVLTRDLGDVYLVAEPVGSVLFLSIAPDKAHAEALMSAILGQQGK